MDDDDLLQEIAQSVVQGNADLAGVLAAESIQRDLDPLRVIDAGYVAGLSAIGLRFAAEEVFLPEMMLSVNAVQRAMTLLGPELTRRSIRRASAGRAVLGTSLGDIHDIGKNLLGVLLSAEGFEVHDLGVDVAPARFVREARDLGANVVAVSAMLTTAMAAQHDVVKALDAAGLRPAVKVIVGGAPVHQDWADHIGADGYASNAMAGARLARELVASPTAPGPTPNMPGGITNRARAIS